MTAFDAAVFQAARRGRFGADLRLHAVLGSTQDEARRLDGVDGTVVLAESQEAGRGRWGRHWQAAPGLSLLFTLRLKATASGTLPLLLGLATAEALRGLDVAARVKWPNDLWVGERKLGGFLLETDGPWVLAGCGLNVLQGEADFPPELRTSATSLHLQGLAWGREVLMAAILGAWEKSLDEWSTAGFGPFLARFEAVDVLRGRPCRARSAGQDLKGQALGVDLSGALRLRLPDGEERLLQSAEIELVRPSAPD